MEEEAPEADEAVATAPQYVAGLTFDRISTGEEDLHHSHKSKLDDMIGWSLSPFTAFHILPVNKAKTIFRLHPKAVATTCLGCQTKKANAKCKFLMCKKCCLEKQQADSVICKMHRLTLPRSCVPAAKKQPAVPPREKRANAKSKCMEEDSEEEDFDEDLLEEESD